MAMTTITILAYTNLTPSTLRAIRGKTALPLHIPGSRVVGHLSMPKLLEISTITALWRSDNARAMYVCLTTWRLAWELIEERTTRGRIFRCCNEAQNLISRFRVAVQSQYLCPMFESVSRNYSSPTSYFEFRQKAQANSQCFLDYVAQLLDRRDVSASLLITSIPNEQARQSHTWRQLTFNLFEPINPFHFAYAFACLTFAPGVPTGQLARKSGHVPLIVLGIACHAHLDSPVICTQSPLRTRMAAIRLFLSSGSSISSSPRATKKIPSQPKLKLAKACSHCSLTSRCTGMKSLLPYNRQTPDSDLM